ncbi:hypothetical protein C4565_09760 [Candidatus Parcubacteria bacterium]|nr:MAG: hypothetical protein C4565_09760 [Candidatus Parcubacteria bacterium]
MDDDVFSEKRIEELVKHGRKNQRTERLIANWCCYARVERSPGRGLVEEMYNVPIGHMGVRCEHAPAGGMMCWDLEDAFLYHYDRNCKSCDKRSAQHGPNIQPVIDEFESKQAQQKAQEEKREQEAAIELANHRRERQNVFDQTIPASVEIQDLLDSIDTGEDQESKRRLIELARLAPDTFTSNIIDYLKKQAVTRQHRLGRVSADVLLTLPLEEEIKLEVALAICDYGLSELVCYCLEKNASKIPASQVEKIIGPLTYRAAPPRFIGGPSHTTSNSKPLISIAKAHAESVQDVLKGLLEKNNEHDVDIAARIIAKITAELPRITELFRRDILAKLLRRRHLLPTINKRGSDDGLDRLRQAATALFEENPESSESILSSLCDGGDATASKEAAEIYSRALEDRWDGPVLEVTPARCLAFNRLLWMAVKNTPEVSDHHAAHFFHYTRNNLVKIAAAEIDSLYGAAAMLSQKAEQIDKEKTVKTAPTGMEVIERANARSAVNQLQKAFIKWAFMASKHEGLNGVKRIIELFEKTPETEVLFRANIVQHLTELIADTDTFNCVLPHLYTAMTSTETLVRGSAATAIGNASFDIRRDFPDLLFEVYVALMSDPYVYVHQSAVRSLKSHSFPEYLKPRLKYALINLIKSYYHETDKAEFLVECLKKFVEAFLTETEIEGNTGKALVGVIDSLPDREACDAIERLTFSFRNAPGFAKVIAKRLDCERAHDFMLSKLYRALFQVPAVSLKDCVNEIYNAGKLAASTNAHQARIPISLLARAGAFDRAQKLCAEILEELPDTREQESLRAFIESLRRIADFEASLPKSFQELKDEQKAWASHIESIEHAQEEEDDHRHLPPMLFR